MAWGRGGALVHESSGVVTSCSAGDVSAGASRARVGEVELAQQLGRVLNLRLEAVIVWGGVVASCGKSRDFGRNTHRMSVCL